MDTTTEPVFFENRNKMRLFGILHRPDSARKDVAIIILSPGIKSRVAPHRLYVKMAKRFSEMGFCVLRFDPHGIGDSEGEIEERMSADFYGSVQMGRFVSDTIDAMDWMEKDHGISRFILAGLCGGAITGLLAGAADKRVHSLLGLGIPVVLDSANIDRNAYITAGQLASLREKYTQKLFKPSAWLRFLTFRSDYRVLLKSFLVRRRHTAAGYVKPTCVAKTNDNVGMVQQRDNTNPHFPAAFHRMLSDNRRILLIFSESDRLYWEYEEKFVQRYPDRYRSYEDRLAVYVTKDANHTFTFSEWQEDMLRVAISWLENNYGY